MDPSSYQQTDLDNKYEETVIHIYDVEEALVKLGGFGKYQRKVVCMQLLIFMTGSYALYPMGFYELQPEYNCRHFDSEADQYTNWYGCENTDFCPEFHIND